jgi:hypothetical protein
VACGLDLSGGHEAGEPRANDDELHALSTRVLVQLSIVRLTAFTTRSTEGK